MSEETFRDYSAETLQRMTQPKETTEYDIYNLRKKMTEVEMMIIGILDRQDKLLKEITQIKTEIEIIKNKSKEDYKQ